MDADVGNAPEHEHQQKQPTEQSSQSLPPCSKQPLKPQPSDTHDGVDEDNGVGEENDKNRMDICIF